MQGRADQVVHGGWTLAARHAGVVLGLVLLAPVLTTALDENRDEAIRAGAAVVLDSEIPPLDKLGVAQDVLDEVDRADEVGELPDVERAFEGRPDDDEWRALVDGLQEQLDRAVTSAFSGPFLLAAALTLCALVPVVLPPAAIRMRRVTPFLVALGLVAAVVVPYLALGGGRFEPTPVADPCEARERPDADGLGRRSSASRSRPSTASRASSASHARTSCSRCAARRRSPRSSEEQGIDRDELEQAINDGLVRAVDDAAEAGALPGFVAPLVRSAAESVPPWLILETLERLGSFLPG